MAESSVVKLLRDADVSISPECVGAECQLTLKDPAYQYHQYLKAPYISDSRIEQYNVRIGLSTQSL